MNKFELVKKEIESILPNSSVEEELIHARLVLKWILKLRPDSDEALKIAALSHDIERAVTGKSDGDLKDLKEKDYEEYKKNHSIKSAKIISDILLKFNYPKKVIEKVKHLVENHEFGGDDETNILTDADSLSYFEYNVPFYFKKYGKDRTKQKIKFMYNRLSEKGKKLAREMKYIDKNIKILIDDVISGL